MIKLFILFLFAAVVMNGILYTQQGLKLNDKKETLKPGVIKNETAPAVSKTKSALPLVYYTALFINPMLVIEDKKPYFALTKEISIAYYPLGRLAFEYSYVFRSANTSHLRASYNYDIVLEAGDFAAFILSPGAGYFTDTQNKGWFGQASFGVILPIGIAVTYPYIRYRHTFIQDKPAGKTDIDDLSLGMGVMFFLNN